MGASPTVQVTGNTVFLTLPGAAWNFVSWGNLQVAGLTSDDVTVVGGVGCTLASVGLGRRDDPVATPKEPVMNVRAPAKGQTGSQPRAAQPQVQIDTSLDDDQLEIPAFLRRQAN